MSGHSKWHNIQATKNKADAKRAKIFTKIGREISVAVKLGGPDPTTNSKLADVIQKAKSNNPYLFPKIVYGNEVAKAGKLKHLKEIWKHPELFVEGHMDKSSIEQTVRKLGKRSGVSNCHPHRFRRTCATYALRHGMPIEQVSKILGHEQLSTTQIYLDMDEQALKTAHKRYVV